MTTEFFAQLEREAQEAADQWWFENVTVPAFGYGPPAPDQLKGLDAFLDDRGDWSTPG